MLFALFSFLAVPLVALLLVSAALLTLFAALLLLSAELFVAFQELSAAFSIPSAFVFLLFLFSGVLFAQLVLASPSLSAQVAVDFPG